MTSLLLFLKISNGAIGTIELLKLWNSMFDILKIFLEQFGHKHARSVMIPMQALPLLSLSAYPQISKALF
jgi:hypothetical protein